MSAETPPAEQATPAPAAERSGILGYLLDPTVEQTRATARVVGPVFVGCAAVLVPWTVYLYVALPSRAVSHNHDLSWAGFDAGMILTLVLTTIALVRRSRWLPVASSSLGALLLVDAWFDILTSRPGGEQVMALVMAAFVEVPLAVVAYWLAYHGQALRERAIAVRLVRAVRKGTPLLPPRRNQRLQ